MNALQRPALGQNARIGTLYDGRNDTFLPNCLLPDGSMQKISSANEQPQIDTNVNFLSTCSERFSLMGIEPDLGASLLARLTNPAGSALYLREMQETTTMLQAAVQYKFIVCEEKLDFGKSHIKDLVDAKVLQNSKATHVVIGVDWGAQTIFNVRHWLDSGDAHCAEQLFSAEIERLASAITNSSADALEPTGLHLEIKAYSDIFQRSGIVIQDFQEVLKFVELVPLQVGQENGGNGWPTMYTLLPINTVSLVLGLGIHIKPSKPPTVIVSIDAQSLHSIVHLFDALHDYETQLHIYHTFIMKHRRFVAGNHIHDVNEYIRSRGNWSKTLQKQYADLLLGIRTGRKSPLALQEFQERIFDDNLPPVWSASMAKAQLEKIRFIGSVVDRGAKYVGHNSAKRNSIIAPKSIKESWTLYINSDSLADAELWAANKELFLQLIDEKKGKNRALIVVDCDATGETLSKARITYQVKGGQVVKDLVAREEMINNIPIACYADGSLELDVPKPLGRRPLRAVCPKPTCSPKNTCDWHCSRCLQPLEYGHTDEFVYCDCGRSLYSNFEFRCNEKTHRKAYVTYDRKLLAAQLTNLAEAECLNILILGETGVGKSTFINAFVNYLTFETLEDAKTEDLNWVVPCSFSMQRMDRSGGAKAIEKFDIKIGNRVDEVDGSKGLSATQQTTVYPVRVNGNTIRLIDTAGIGDTRGISYDKKNMADLLSTLNGYDKVHGILILLKSNNSRLTVTFNFCMKELLTHLHRSAAVNMAFGFTNTRISNYNPGDTFGPLSTLLDDHADIGLSLTSETAYCFDSESFRYLAALKNNVPMDNEEDYHRSWKQSRDEVMRLLGHFKSRPPHSVKSTVSLNGARQLVLELTKPMAEISQIIRTNIAMCEDRVQELRNTRLTGQKLRKRLHLDKKQLQARQLPKPRTVCTDTACVEYKDDGKGENRVVVVYKTHCHPECYLTDVTADQIAHSGLIRCAAFNGSMYCSVCTHHWQEHLHVLYELEESTVSVKDTEVERQLLMNADDLELRKTAVAELERRQIEYTSEHHHIQETMAKFGFFLKKNSITPYNDATLAYLDLLIREEEGKIQIGGNKTKLRSLHEDRSRHIELVDVLTNTMSTSSDLPDLNEEHVEQLVTNLYSLEHFGANLKSVNLTISSAHQSTYRERPHQVYGQNAAGWNSSWGWTMVMSKSRKGQGNKQSKRGGKNNKTGSNTMSSGSLVSGFQSFISKAPYMTKY